jgi:hypothetical protein
VGSASGAYVGMQQQLTTASFSVGLQPSEPNWAVRTEVRTRTRSYGRTETWCFLSSLQVLCTPPLRRRTAQRKLAIPGSPMDVKDNKHNATPAPAHPNSTHSNSLHTARAPNFVQCHMSSSSLRAGHQTRTNTSPYVTQALLL